MKLFYFVRVLITIFLMKSTLVAGLNDKSAFVYYGNDISYPMAGIHDYIIVEPNNIEVSAPGFKKYRNNIYAYMSVNEISKNGAHAKEIKRDWIIGDNPNWGSYVMNITNRNYQNYLLKRLQKLQSRGFKNFFFDTLDSYQLAPVSKEEKEQLRQGLIQFIHRFSQQFPKAKLIINRGFDIIDAVHSNIEAVLFESYYNGLDSSTMRYKKMSQEDRAWLDTQLKKVKAYHIPIIAVDYQDLNDKKAIKQNILKLQKKGFIPYIAEKTLTYTGYSSKNAFKREVLIIYNGRHLEKNLVASTYAHLFASMPLEHMGYIPVLKDANQALPAIESSRYAGIIIWLENADLNMNHLMRWVKGAIKSGVKVLFLGDNSLNLKHPLAKELGLFAVKNRATKGSKNHIVHASNIMNYEIKPSIKYHKLFIDLHQKSTPYLVYKNSQNQTSTIAAKTAWGGYVRSDALISDFFGDDAMWVINPFQLFRETLRLAYFPAPDPTTENGKRLAFIHIDGDGSMNKVENNTQLMSMELIERDFIRKYKFPQSVSVVESETAPYGKYPQYSKRLEAAARKMYAQPYVEGATHTFTHPYQWRALEKDPGNPKYRTNLKRHYTYTTKREISDSLDYINRRLMPKGKKARTIFWSGDCSPSQKVIKYTYAHHILNINRGDTTITNDQPWLLHIQPFGIKYGNFYQIYAGAENENVYTNDWHGPFWGFKKVIQTFKLTENPRRIKPIDIYYHFYAASKKASYTALKEVYDWVAKQDVMHIFTSDYIKKVIDFYNVSIAQEGNRWLLKGFSNLRTVRIHKSLGLPDIEKSIGVVGYKRKGDELYVHLDEKKRKVLTLTYQHFAQNYLISSNARLVSKRKNHYHFIGEMPVTLDFHLKKGCVIKTQPKVDRIHHKADRVSLQFTHAKDVYVTTICK